MLCKRIAVLLLLASSALATPVAPLPPQIAPLYADDRHGESATNGQSTLVVWTSEFSPYVESHTVEMRLLDDSASDRLAVPLARGHDPKAASNGNEYLVGYSIGASRFNTYPYDNVAVTIVNTDGSRGATRAINHSLAGAIGDVAWNGTDWIVGFTSDGIARVVFVARDMSMRFLELGGGSIDSIVQIDGATWAVRRDPAQDSSELVEIRTDASVGERFPLEDAAVRIVPTAHGALAFVSTGEGISVARFETAGGFTALRPLVPAATFHDVEPWNGGALLLMTPYGTTTAVGIAVDSEGNVVERSDLLRDVESLSELRLGESRDGLLLFHARRGNDGDYPGRFDLYAYELNGLTPLDPARGELVSKADIARQHSGSIASAGNHALAVWTQTIDAAGHEAVFTRMIGADGKPLNAPVQLPLAFYGPPELVFDGDGFVLVGTSADSTIVAARLSIDGAQLGPVFEVAVGPGAALAKSDNDLFVVWVHADGQVRGTPLRHDGSPVVPGGFAILPALVGAQGGPAIAANPAGFQILWSEPGVASVIISPAGTPRSKTAISDDFPYQVLLASSTHSALAAWQRTDGSATLYTFGDRPFEPFDPHWGEMWWPRAIFTIGEDRYFVVIVRDGFAWSSEITMSSGFITGITPLQALGTAIPTEHGVAFVNGTLLLLSQSGRELHVMTTTPARNRAVRR